jgi:O-methyltransferase domain/Dimerisation domain
MQTQAHPNPSQAGAMPPDPAPIMQTATGFMAAKHLFASSEAGLFEALADGPLPADQLAEKTGIPPATAEMSAGAMVALGLLELDGGRYRNSDAAAHFLAGRTPADLRPFLRFWGRLSWRVWTDFEDALCSGPAPLPPLGAEDTLIFADGVEAITAGAAHALAAQPEIAGARRLLDVAGGTGSFLAAAIAAHPGLEGTLVELPAVAAVAQEKLAGVPGATVQASDVLQSPLPHGHDVLLAANLVHLFAENQIRVLLAAMREAAEPGATLLIVDFWTDPTHTEPAMAALMAGEFYMYSGGDGRVYSDAEFRPWLSEAGWKPVEVRELAGPQSVLVATAVD